MRTRSQEGKIIDHAVLKPVGSVNALVSECRLGNAYHSVVSSGGRVVFSHHAVLGFIGEYPQAGERTMAVPDSLLGLCWCIAVLVADGLFWRICENWNIVIVNCAAKSQSRLSRGEAMKAYRSFFKTRSWLSS